MAKIQLRDRITPPEGTIYEDNKKVYDYNGNFLGFILEEKDIPTLRIKPPPTPPPPPPKKLTGWW